MCNISLDVLCALGGIPHMMEDLAHCGLVEHLADERNGGCDV